MPNQIEGPKEINNSHHDKLELTVSQHNRPDRPYTQLRRLPYVHKRDHPCHADDECVRRNEREARCEAYCGACGVGRACRHQMSDDS